MAQSGVRGERTRRGVRRAGGPGRGNGSAPGTAQDPTPVAGSDPASDGGGSGGRGGSGGSRRASGGRRGRQRSGRRRPGRHRVLRWFAITVAVLILGTAGAGYLYYLHLNGNIKKGQRNSGESGVKKGEANADGQTPLNILMIGSDSRNSAKNVKLGGDKDSVGSKPRADVQMLIHLSADRKSASVVSIPRDTRVDIPKCTDPDTGDKYAAKNTIINESLARGGPGCTLATWQNLTGVYIDHWMMIDFAGVVDMADAVGGVDVCVRQNVWDRPLPGVGGGSGLKLKAGTHNVKGEEALQWLRTRHAFFSDLGRAKAQHIYMNSMIRTLKNQNVFTDGGRLTDLAEAATKSLKVSEEIGTVKKLYDLGMQLKTVPTSRFTMTTMPTIQDPLDKDHLVPAATDADKVWAMVRGDVSFDKGGKAGKGGASASPGPSATSTGPAAAPAGTLAVSVVNGTGGDDVAAVGQRATAVASTLQGKGFTRALASTAPDPQARTLVTYAKGAGAQGKADALSVATALGVPSGQVRASDDVTALTLTVGADWRSGAAYPKQSVPSAGDLPVSADAVHGADTGDCMEIYKPYRF
ncbi:LCP family protein [Streptomyces sp. SAS_270]|uniref:LCP family protein n=1 Tax=Streptomyces sp. SAS_270 TaxID=3412748 RepID=UPI00403C386C